MKIENVKNVLQHGQPEFNIDDVVLLSDDDGSFDTSIKYVVMGIEWIVNRLYKKICGVFRPH